MMNKKDMKNIELTASEYLIAKIVVQSFRDDNSYIIITIRNDVKPYIPSVVSIGDTTIYNAIRKLNNLNIIKSTFIKGKGLNLVKGENFNTLKRIVDGK